MVVVEDKIGRLGIVEDNAWKARELTTATD
jgi:hypothetical protein